MTAKLLPARLFLAVCLLASTLAACSGAQNPPAPVSAAVETADPGAEFAATGEMVNVRPVLDEPDTVYALVPQRGGEIKLELANGLAFTLTIPEGALISDQEVTITPIRQVEGLPLSGGLIAGVQLEPDGTALMKPALLTIQVPAGYDTTGMVGFGYHGQGEGFYMTPAEGDGATIQLEIFSFSGHGAASGTQADIDAQAGNKTTTWYEEYKQRQAQGQKSESEQQMEDFRNREWGWLKGYYARLRDLLKQAAQNEGLVDPATSLWYTWQHEIELLHLQDEFTKEIEEARTLLIRALRNSFDRASQKCVNNKDINQLANMQKRLYTLAQLLDDGYTLESKMPEFERCARFKLQFESKLKWELETQMEIEGNVSGEAVMRNFETQGDSFRMLYKGKGEARFNQYTIGFSGTAEEIGNKCDIETPEKPGRLYAAGRIYWMNLSTTKPQFSTILGLYVTGMGQQMSKWNCATGEHEGFSLTVPTEMPTWYSGFRLLHESEKKKFEEFDEEYYFFWPMTYESANHPAAYEHKYTGSQGANKVNEDFKLNLYAAPGQ